MPQKKTETSPGFKLLSMYEILLQDSKPHYQVDLAKRLQCSPQTVSRLATEIELFTRGYFESSLENRRRWYRIRTTSASSHK